MKHLLPQDRFELICYIVIGAFLVLALLAMFA